MKKYDFNISYSALATYNSCQRLFYYTYIAKEKPSDFVTDAYSLAGSLVHSFIENYYISHKAKKITLDEIKHKFDMEWTILKLDEKPGFFNRFLNKEQYWQAIVNALNSKYNITKFEEKIQFNDLYTVKGFLDAVVDDGEIIIDWKTNSSVDEGQIKQLQFYAYLYYRKHKRLPKKFILEYVKINKRLQASFDIKDVIEMRNLINNFVKEITNKSSFKEWSINKNACAFCGFKTKCSNDNIDKKQENFVLKIKNNKIYFLNELTTEFKQMLDDKTSYEIDNKFFVIQACKAKGFDWDGIVRHFKNNTISLGFYSLVIKTIQEYSEKFNKKVTISIDDARKELKQYKIDKKTDIVLRSYQENAINTMLHNKIGILALATGAGKTIISAELIHKVGTKTLFVIDNKSLLEQTKKVYEEYLDTTVGTITSGDFKPELVTVATIQTIRQLIKKKNKDFIKYLSSIQLVIFDEAHISKSKSYQELYKKLVNCHYFISLTGTPGKNKKQFLDLQAITGDVICEINAQELITKDFLTKPDIRFVKYKFKTLLQGTYSEVYEQVIENTNRNEIIINLTKKHSNDKVLILVSRIEHGLLLQKLLKDNNINSQFIQGAMSMNTREKILDDFKNNNLNVIIGSSTIVSKGLDLPNLSVLINATGFASDIQTIQSLGRILRKHKSKESAKYYDFYDDIPYLRDHSLERIQHFKEEGHEVKLENL